MKCSRCGHRANSIGGMGKHVRAKHPSVFKNRKVRVKSAPKRAPQRRSRSRRTATSSPDVSTSESGGTITITIQR